MDDTGLQSALNQLPQNLEQPVSPSQGGPVVPAAPTSPPPVNPPTPPVNPVPEKPATKMPSGKFKKAAPKFIVGALMLLLLAGGAWFGVGEVQKRQVVEQQAAGARFTCTIEQSRQNLPCIIPEGATWQDSWCELNVCPNGDTTGEGACSAPDDAGSTVEFGECFGYILPKARSLGTTCYQVDTVVSRNDFHWCNLSSPISACTGYEDNFDTCAPVTSPLPSPSPSPSVSPRPSPSPSPTVACVDLTKSVDAPKVGDSITFTCEANVSTASSVAFFRYSRDGGISFSGSLPSDGVTVNATTHQASYNITIDQAGNWEVQCQVCGQADTAGAAPFCTDWGKAQ